MAESRDLHCGRRVLIAGYGSIGRRHFQNLRTIGCDDFVFYRTRQGTIEDDDASGFPSFADLDEALAQEPQLVVIANPTAQHVPVALAAARAGCDLFIEKPLSATLDDCDELQKVVREKQLIVMIGCNFRFHPLLMQLRDELRAGRLGTVVGARAEWGEFLPDWHPWEDYRKSYSARGELGGGVVLTLIHPIDYLYWLFGGVCSVQAMLGAVESLSTPAGEDWAEITLRFENKVIAQVHLDYLQRPAVHQLAVWGDGGRAVWDYHAGSLVWTDTRGQQQVDRVAESFERNDMYLAEMKHFIECTRDRRQSQIPLADGIAVLEIALRAKRVRETIACG